MYKITGGMVGTKMVSILEDMQFRVVDTVDKILTTKESSSDVVEVEFSREAGDIVNKEIINQMQGSLDELREHVRLYIDDPETVYLKHSGFTDEEQDGYHSNQIEEWFLKVIKEAVELEGLSLRVQEFQAS